MYGQGLLKGMAVTIKHFFGKAITEQYPERKPDIAERFHGFFELDLNKCNACNTCATTCPNGVITVTSARDPETNKRYTTGFEMHIYYCLFCGLCVESCPRDALHFTKEYELAQYRKSAVVCDLAKKGEKR